MDLVKSLEQANLTYSIKGQPCTKLEDCLALLKKDDLSLIAATHNIAGRSRLKKQELVDAISGHILNPEYLHRALLLADRSEWNAFCRFTNQPAAEDELYPSDYFYFLQNGLMFTFFDGEKLYVVVPEEIQAGYLALTSEDFNAIRERQMLVTDYIKAAIALYGICKLDKLIEIFNSQNGEELTKDELLNICDLQLSREQTYYIHEDYLLDGYFQTTDAGWLHLENETRDKPFYIPAKQELLRYADPSYFERTLQLERLQTHIQKRICQDPAVVEEMIGDIQGLSFAEASLDELLGEFQRRKISLSRKQVEDIVPLLVDVLNNTRQWANRGFTPEELRLQSGGSPAPVPSNVVNGNFQQRIVADKVGRNDPCPCGSGKKHKKCCGAN